MHRTGFKNKKATIASRIVRVSRLDPYRAAPPVTSDVAHTAYTVFGVRPLTYGIQGVRPSSIQGVAVSVIGVRPLTYSIL